MKKLVIRRHSIKDGPDNTIGPRGYELAERIGRETDDEEIPKRIFHGPTVRTIQTVLGYCRGLEFVPSLMPEVQGLGDGTFFAEAGTAAYKDAVAFGQSPFRAVCLAHHGHAVERWAVQAHNAVKAMLAKLADEEIGVGFFHSPNIELAAWACGAEHADIAGWDELQPMEGLVFVSNDNGLVHVIEKVGVAENSPA